MCASQSVCIFDEKLQKVRNHLLLWNALLLGSDRVELKRDVPEVCNQLQFYTDNAPNERFQCQPKKPNW